LGGRKNTRRIEKNIIVPIHKIADRDRRESYRGIPLGNAAYRILTNIVLEKIKPYIEGITEQWNE
jgi:hypothetical protein